MSAFGLWTLQKAIYNKLTVDASLMAQVTGIYDHVPQDTPHPYVVIGEAEGRDNSTKTSSSMQYIVRLRIFSREGGRKQAAAIMERIYLLLHDGSLTIAGHTLIFSRMESCDVRLLGDGVTYQGLIQFRMVLEAV